jgi:hypothetical protein
MEPGAGSLEATKILKLMLPPRVVAGLWAAWLLRGQPMSATVLLALEAYFQHLGPGPRVAAEVPQAASSARR